MKRLIILGLVFLMHAALFAQNFISSSKQWNVRIAGWGESYVTDIFKIDGDSTVNSVIYSEIWVSHDSLSTWHFQGLLREDSNVVYYIPPVGNEGVLYDFNLEIGETAFINNISCTEVSVSVIDIDTVEYFGISRKRLLLGEDGYVQDSWVEGIGSLSGPLHTKIEYCMVCPAWDLLCFHNNDMLEYILYGQTDCYQHSVGIKEDFKEAGFAINPNPVKRGNSFYIETNTVPENIKVSNSPGQLRKNISSFTGTKMKIETKHFESGLYFITVTTRDKKIETQKILIE